MLDRVLESVTSTEELLQAVLRSVAATKLIWPRMNDW